MVLLKALVNLVQQGNRKIAASDWKLLEKGLQAHRFVATTCLSMISRSRPANAALLHLRSVGVRQDNQTRHEQTPHEVDHKCERLSFLQVPLFHIQARLTVRGPLAVEQINTLFLSARLTFNF